MTGRQTDPASYMSECVLVSLGTVVGSLSRTCLPTNASHHAILYRLLYLHSSYCHGKRIKQRPVLGGSSSRFCYLRCYNYCIYSIQYSVTHLCTLHYNKHQTVLCLQISLPLLVQFYYAYTKTSQRLKLQLKVTQFSILVTQRPRTKTERDKSRRPAGRNSVCVLPEIIAASPHPAPHHIHSSQTITGLSQCSLRFLLG